MRASLSVAIALAVAGCHDQARAPASERSQKANAAEPAVPSTAALTEEPAEVELSRLLGVWRVIHVLPGPKAQFERDDPQVTGSLMDMLPDKLAWSYTPGTAFAPADQCIGPVSGLIAEPSAADEARRLVAPALAFRTGDTISRPHTWLCGDGGDWGNEEADFQLIGEDRLAMRWPGNLTLVLDRIRRVSSDPATLPPTGAFQGR